jgi:hypothetical protein
MNGRARVNQGVGALGLILLLVACAGPVGSPGQASAMPTVPTATAAPASISPSTSAPISPSATARISSPSSPATLADISRFAAAARAFADRFNANSADAPTAFSAFSDQAVIIDPSNADFTIGPGADLVDSWAGFAAAFPDYRAVTTGTYVSDAAAAFPTEVEGLPVNLPAGLLHELRVFRFTDDTASTASSLELWYRVRDTLANPDGIRLDCVAPDRCLDDAAAFADAYLAAWTSGNPGTIASLYREDAVFNDGVRALTATGAGPIAGLAPVRWGGTLPRCQVQDVYAQTDNGDPSASDSGDPKGGTIAGIAIVHRCELPAAAGSGALDAVSLLIFGTRQPHSFDNDPRGLIVSEDVLYDPGTLTSAGVVP